MELAISLKFSQHKDLREDLLSTGDAALIYVRATHALKFSRSGLTDVRRTQKKIHSGVVGQMEKEKMSLGRRSNVFVTHSVNKIFRSKPRSRHNSWLG